jgi:hypothetical protein
MSEKNQEINTKTLAETENLVIWQADEPDSEVTYYLQLNNVTVHFFQEEWDEFLVLISKLK